MDDLAMPPEERLAQVHDRVTPTPAPSDLVHLGDGNCWIWNLGKTRGGYGKVRAFGLYTVAHRWAYTLLVGPIPDGHQLDHLCGIPACVAPHHLEPVTPGENFDRARPAHAEAMRRRSARVREAAI